MTRRMKREQQEPKTSTATGRNLLAAAKDMGNCGECLWNKTEVVALINGLCPKCGTNYRRAP